MLKRETFGSGYRATVFKWFSCYSIENLTLDLAWSPKPAWVDFILGTDPSPQLLVPEASATIDGQNLSPK